MRSRVPVFRPFTGIDAALLSSYRTGIARRARPMSRLHGERDAAQGVFLPFFTQSPSLQSPSLSSGPPAATLLRRQSTLPA
jgi:hypothetical protein